MNFEVFVGRRRWLLHWVMIAACNYSLLHEVLVLTPSLSFIVECWRGSGLRFARHNLRQSESVSNRSLSSSRSHLFRVKFLSGATLGTLCRILAGLLDNVLAHKADILAQHVHFFLHLFASLEGFSHRGCLRWHCVQYNYCSLICLDIFCFYLF